MRIIQIARLAFLSAFLANPATARAPHVLTDTAVTHSLVAQVMGDVGTPELLLEHVWDPHHLQLRPSQARALAQADVFFWIGAPLTPWLEGKVDALGAKRAAYALIDASGTKLLSFDEGAIEDHDEHNHHEGDLDPHAWLDPDNARAWLGEIAAILATHDPENSVTYHANAARAQAGVETLTGKIADIFVPATARKFIASHDAFGYLSARFGLRVEGAISDGHSNAPGAAGLSELRRIVKTEKVDCIFAQAPGPDRQAERLAADAGIESTLLDVNGTQLKKGPALYGEMMQSLAERIAQCGAPD